MGTRATEHEGRTCNAQRGSQTALDGEHAPNHLHIIRKSLKHRKNTQIHKNNKLHNRTDDRHRKVNQQNKVHGDKLKEKESGYTRLVFENFNGLAA